MSLSIQGKKLRVFVASDKIWAFKQNFEFKTCIPTLDLMASQHLKTFLMWSAVIFMNGIFWYYIIKCVNICNIYISQWTNIFQRPVYDVTILCMVKRFIQSKKKNRLVTLMYRKFFCVQSPHWNQPLRNYHKLSFGIVSMKNVQNYLKWLLIYSSLFQLHICVRPDFLHIVQKSQHIESDQVLKQIRESSCLLLTQALKWFLKKCHSSH